MKSHWLDMPAILDKLLERGELNSGASGGNAGSLHVQMLSHFARLTKPQEMLDAERPLALHLAGVEEWKRLRHDLEDDFQLHVAGGLMVAETAEEVRALEAKITRERRHGLEIELMTGAAARKRAPYLGGSVQATAWCASEGKLNRCW
jgi:glycine/D-amino acid oxidase-like deaminating enzyme